MQKIITRNQLLKVEELFEIENPCSKSYFIDTTISEDEILVLVDCKDNDGSNISEMNDDCPDCLNFQNAAYAVLNVKNPFSI